MTVLLAHPAEEDLGRFVEGTLDDPERAGVVSHIADCDECRILVVDAAEFIEPAKRESHRWWQVAAAVIVIAIGGGLFWNVSRDFEAPMREASSHLKKRATESRLVGFSYVELRRNRGSGEGSGESEVDPAGPELDAAIADVLARRGDDPKTSHAKGIAYLLAASTATVPDEIQSDRINALTALQAAADRAPDNVSYQTDLAAALLETGEKGKRQLALAHLDKALSIDPHNPEALFDKALALREENPKEAIAAFNRYLAVDSTSKWADEARRNIEDLQEAL
jgi:tetratricopeptide (TPR) repeat protein